MTDAPKTLLAAVRYFSDPAVCNEYMKQVKWPDGTITCPKCQGERVGEVATRGLLRCKDCRKQFSYKVGTLMEDSALPLGHWFTAIWCVANDVSVSSRQLAALLGITQRSALLITSRISAAMHLTHHSTRIK